MSASCVGVWPGLREDARIGVKAGVSVSSLLSLPGSLSPPSRLQSLPVSPSPLSPT